MRHWGAIVVLAVMLLSAGLSQAEMDGAEYGVQAVLAPAEREAAARRIAEERAAEEERRAALARQAAEEHARRQAAEQARPYAERLIELRCQTCHEAGYYQGKFHGSLGWTAVILRMILLNGAEVSAADRAVLVEHLVATQPPTPVRQALEWAVLASSLAAVAVPPFVYGLRRRKGRQSS